MPPPDHLKPKHGLTFYPAFCYKASPTWQKWVKLTCWDVHEALRPHHQHGQSYTSSGPNANLTLFYINHPIQYVQVVGIVVAIEDYQEHFFLLTLDDSSGSTLDIVLRKPKPKGTAPQPRTHAAPAKQTRAGRNNSTLSDDDNDHEKNDDDASDDEDTKSKLALLSILHNLTVGTSILAKGTLTTFRGTRQLSLLRLQILPSTNAELAHAASRTAFLAHTLGKPWTLSESRIQKLRAAAHADTAHQSTRAKRERARRKEQAEWEDRREQLLRERYAEEEVLRRQAADEARRDGERVMMLRRSERVTHVSVPQEQGKTKGKAQTKRPSP